MDWFRFVKLVLPLVIQVVETIHGPGSGQKKRATALRIAENILDHIPGELAFTATKDAIGVEIDAKVKQMNQDGVLPHKSNAPFPPVRPPT